MSKIILKNVGRGKVNRTIEVKNPIVDGKPEFDEEHLAMIAYKEVNKHLASRAVDLDPDEDKGAGFWKVYVGLGIHVGDVQIII